METMTPSVEEVKITTNSQISKAVGNYRVLLEKHAPEFSSEAFQQGIGHPNLAIEMFALLRKYIEMFANLITRVVTGIDRTLTPEQVLKNTGREQYIDKSVVASMPRGEGDSKTLIFFKPDLGEKNGFISDDDLEKEFKSRRLKPADPYSLSKANQDDKAFAGTHPNATHWKDENGKWCYAAFYRGFDDERYVNVYRVGNGWYGNWWFAGIPE